MSDYSVAKPPENLQNCFNSEKQQQEKKVLNKPLFSSTTFTDNFQRTSQKFSNIMIG